MDINSLKLLVSNNFFLAIFPEICLVLAMLLALVLSLSPKLSSKAWLFVSPLLILGFAFCVLLFSKISPSDSLYSFKGTFLLDSFSLLLKGLIFLVLICLNFAGGTYLSGKGVTAKGEYSFLLLGASLGASFLVSANDMILLFVALETLSLSSIALVAFVKQDAFSGEAAIKYLLNGAVASACLLFALSIIFGITMGDTHFSALPEMTLSRYAIFSDKFPLILFSLALFLTVAAVAFKLSLAPFHHWAPDVYNGASLPTTAFLATISKIAAFAIFCRLGWTFFGVNWITSIPFGIWCNLFAVLAILSMFIGNLVGARQIFRSNGSIKRLFAYSSVAQIGYVISGAVIGTDVSTSQSLFYLTMYVIVNLGAFLGLIKFEEWLQRNNLESVNADSLESLKGLFKVKPKLAVFMGVCIANLAAILPSMVFAKFILISASLNAGLASFLPAKLIQSFKLIETPFAIVIPQIGLLMAIMILVSSIVAIFYYASLIKMMFVDEPQAEVFAVAQKEYGKGEFNINKFLLNFACVVLLTGSIALSIFPEFWIGKVAGGAAQSLIISSSNDLLKAIDESVKK